MIGELFIDQLEAVLRLVGVFLVAKQQACDSKNGKNGYGEIVTSEDILTQTYVYFVLKKWLPESLVVGEEQIPDSLTDFQFKALLDDVDPNRLYLNENDYVHGAKIDCLTTFPDDLKARLYWVIDPIDGSNNYSHGKDDFAVVVALMLGRSVHLGMSYMPRAGYLLSACGSSVRVRHHFSVSLKPYDETAIKLAFGLGKRQPTEVRSAFSALVQKTDGAAQRFGCMSKSVLALLIGDIDAYVSLKEEAFKFLALWLIATNAGLKINPTSDPSVLSFTRPFRPLSRLRVLPAST
ncbi:MAG: inositol monophosphatase family protein [Pseudomonadota bacterium]